MIPLNSRQRLPRNALWYLALRAFAAAMVLVLVGGLVQLAHNAGAACKGALCGTMSAGQLATLMYLFGGFLVVRAILNYKWFWFVLTDQSISIESGVFTRNSCTVRFDRIQDIDVRRDPLHRMLGLKSVAIWTASLDQRRGKSIRPDGYLVLEADTADWLSDYLSSPPGGEASSASNNRPPGASRGMGRQANAAVPLILVVAAITIVAAGGLWKKTSVTAPAVESAPALTSAPATASPLPPVMAASETKRRAHRVPVETSPTKLASGAQVDPANYTIACSTRGSATVNGARPCAALREAQRCRHEADFPSQPTRESAELTIVNQSVQAVKFYWLDRSGARALYAALPPGGRVSQPSHVGAHWLVSGQDDQCIGIFDAATMTVGIF